jgi:hypothetical protein
MLEIDLDFLSQLTTCLINVLLNLKDEEDTSVL